MTDTKTPRPTAAHSTAPPPAAHAGGPHPISHSPPTHAVPSAARATSPHPREEEGESRSQPSGPGWFARHAALAPWANALGGLLMVIAAWTLATADQRSARSLDYADRVAKAEILTVSIKRDLVILKESFDRVEEIQRSLTIKPERLFDLSLNVPPGLASDRGELYLLGRERGVVVRRVLNDAERVEKLIRFMKEDARGYAEFHAKRGVSEDNGAGTAAFFNDREFETAVRALAESLGQALKLTEHDPM